MLVALAVGLCWVLFSLGFSWLTVNFSFGRVYHWNAAALAATFRKELSECVVEDCCPQGDSWFHRQMDQFNWHLIEKWGNSDSMVLRVLRLRFFINTLLIVPALQELHRSSVQES